MCLCSSTSSSNQTQKIDKEQKGSNNYNPHLPCSMFQLQSYCCHFITKRTLSATNSCFGLWVLNISHVSLEVVIREKKLKFAVIPQKKCWILSPVKWNTNYSCFPGFTWQKIYKGFSINKSWDSTTTVVIIYVFSPYLRLHVTRGMRKSSIADDGGVVLSLYQQPLIHENHTPAFWTYIQTS